MQIMIDISEDDYRKVQDGRASVSMMRKSIRNGTPLDKIRAEIVDCLKALDDIEKSGFNIYLPNEISGRRLTYQQCLEIIDKYKGESEDAE